MAKKKHAQKSQAPKKTNAAKPASNSNAKGSAKKQVHKERGTILTILLVLILVHAILVAYVGYTSLKDEYVKTTWVLPLLTVVALADIVAAAAMWYWKQWGITLYAITCIIQAAVHLMLTGSLLVVFYDILPVAILAYVINLQSKRKLFE